MQQILVISLLTRAFAAVAIAMIPTLVNQLSLGLNLSMCNALGWLSKMTIFVS